MRIHTEGTRIIIILLFSVLVIAFLINVFFPHQTIVHYLLYLAGLLFMAAVVFFFRRPERIAPDIPGAVVSPADGRVVIMEEAFEDEYFHDRRIQVSVFMSLMDAHVNWFPSRGKVRYIQYHPGKFLFAFLHKSSKLNEHNSLVLTIPAGDEILIRQIAGGVARRIICYAKPGEEVKAGQEIGIIKFGSRVDLFLPKECNVKVSLGQKVRGGETVIAISRKR